MHLERRGITVGYSRLSYGLVGPILFIPRKKKGALPKRGSAHNYPATSLIRPASLNFNCPLFRNACRNFGEITRVRPRLYAHLKRFRARNLARLRGELADDAYWGIIRGSCCSFQAYFSRWRLLLRFSVHGDCREM